MNFNSIKSFHDVFRYPFVIIIVVCSAVWQFDLYDVCVPTAINTTAGILYDKPDKYDSQYTI